MKRRRQRRADIDITPLIDVLFMLIIFFVLTATFAQGRIEVDLPAGGGAPAADEAVTLAVGKDGKLSWNGREIRREDIAALARAAGGKEITVAGDKEAAYGDVAAVLEILRAEGVGSAGLLTRGDGGR